MKTRSARMVLSVVLGGLLLALLCGVSAGYSSTVVFCRYGPKTGMTTTFELFTPQRTGDGTIEEFPEVTSKWDMPRDVGTNPHQGCDLDNSTLQNVYALYRGWIEWKGTDQLVLYLDLDKDNVKDDGAWAHYWHLTTVTSKAEGAYIYATEKVGEVVDPPATHLHFGVIKSYDSITHTGLWAPLERYYPQGWNAGQDLDFICTIKQEGNVVKATAYAHDDEYGFHPLDPGDVWLYHRQYGTSNTWVKETMTLVSGSETEWQFNLTGEYSAGTKVAYMVIAQRDENTPADYKWGFFPAKFQQPKFDTTNGPDESWAYDYLPITLQ